MTTRSPSSAGWRANQAGRWRCRPRDSGNTPAAREPRRDSTAATATPAPTVVPVPPETTPLEIPPPPPEPYTPPTRAGDSNCILPVFLLVFGVAAVVIVFVVVAIRKRANPRPLAPSPFLRRAPPRISD